MPSKRGGKRDGAGRPPLGQPEQRPRAVRMTDDQWERFQQRGGAAWLRGVLDGKATG